MLNAVGALVLAHAVIVLRGRLLSLALVLSLLFMVGTLLALVLADCRAVWHSRGIKHQLVPTTLVVESIGTIILAVTVALVLRSRQAPDGRTGNFAPCAMALMVTAISSSYPWAQNGTLICRIRIVARATSPPVEHPVRSPTSPSRSTCSWRLHPRAHPGSGSRGGNCRRASCCDRMSSC